jgi:hypothetical protein
MKATNKRARIAIAVTESSPVSTLWQEVLQHLTGSQADLLALFIADDRWHRAASLPFTREISLVGGTIADFTTHRANQLVDEAATRAQQQIRELAAEAGLPLGFEVLSESDEERIQGLIAGARDVLIAPSYLATRPIFSQLRKTDCRIVLIESKKEDNEQV